MSLTQEPAPEQGFSASIEARQKMVRRRLWTICFALFALEIGCFLLVFPWIDAWTLSHLPAMLPPYLVEVQDVWDDPLLKSAVSALGAMNVYIFLLQVLSLFRKK